MKERLKSVLNYRSYHKNKIGYPFLDHPVHATTLGLGASINHCAMCVKFSKERKADLAHPSTLKSVADRQTFD